MGGYDASGLRGSGAIAYTGRLCAGLAQLVVHLICNQGVGGSIPSAGTNYIKHLRRVRFPDSQFVDTAVDTSGNCPKKARTPIVGKIQWPQSVALSPVPVRRVAYKLKDLPPSLAASIASGRVRPQHDYLNGLMEDRGAGSVCSSIKARDC